MPNPSDPQSYNRYAYVRNNPVNMVDPSGHCFVLAGADTLACGLAYGALAGLLSVGISDHVTDGASTQAMSDGVGVLIDEIRAVHPLNPLFDTPLANGLVPLEGYDVSGNDESAILMGPDVNETQFSASGFPLNENSDLWTGGYDLLPEPFGPTIVEARRPKWRQSTKQEVDKMGEYCYYCGEELERGSGGSTYTRDHVEPFRRWAQITGQSLADAFNDIWNLVPACRSCNSQKGERNIEEWLDNDN